MDRGDYNIPITVLKNHGDNKAYMVYGVKPKIKSVLYIAYGPLIVFSQKWFSHLINTSLADTVLYNKVFRVHLTYKN